MKKIKEYSLLIVSCIILFCVFTNIIAVTRGQSMKPTHGEYGIMIANPLFDKLERFDVVLIQGSSIARGKRIYKRIIGLPGEYVEIIYGEVRINGKILENPYTVWNETTNLRLNYSVLLRDNEYIVLGDNQPYSSDSYSNRRPIVKNNIRSKEIFYIKILN